MARRHRKLRDIGSANVTQQDSVAKLDRGCRRIKDGAAASGELSGSRTNRPPPYPSTPSTPPPAFPSSLTPVASRTTRRLERSKAERARPDTTAGPASPAETASVPVGARRGVGPTADGETRPGDDVT